MVNSKLLEELDGGFQAVLDCVPPVTRILLTASEIPIEGGLTISQSVTISSQVGGTKLQCPVGGIKIRWVLQVGVAVDLEN